MTESSFSKGMGLGCGLWVGLMLAGLLVLAVTIGGCVAMVGGCGAMLGGMREAQKAGKRAVENREAEAAAGPTASVAHNPESPLVELLDVRVGRLTFKQTIGKGTYQSTEPYTLLTVRITNRAKTRKLDYKGSQADMFRSSAFLRDEHGNRYRAQDLSMSEPVGPKGRESIHPGEQLTDLYVFEPVVAMAGTVFLRIDGEALGQSEALTVRGAVVRDEHGVKELPAKTAAPEKPKELEKPATPTHDYRTWTDSSGRYKIEARLVEVIDGRAKLVDRAGKEKLLPLERLSEADQQWIRSQSP